MANATDTLITRNWRFTFWSAHANTFFGVTAAVQTPTGYPTVKDIEEMEGHMLKELQRKYSKERVRGLICTGWSPLDDTVEP